jgi:hypothetical protein
MHTTRRTRRTFLKAAGVSLALPRLDAFAQPAAAVPRRAVFVCAPLGLHAPFFFPTAAGRDYELTPYLEPLRDLRNDFTVASGLAHPDVGPSHDSIFSFLTCAPHPERRAGFRNTISVDQLAAEHVGGETRFASLPLSAEGFGLSWTRTGALVPPDLFPASVFSRLFLDGRPDEVANQARRLRDGRSVLDAVRDQAADMRPALGAADREKMDEYFTSVRELERRLARAEEWSRRPKPKVDARPPQNVLNPADLVGKTRSLFDLIHLALQTDSTRLVTMLMLGTSLVPPIAGVSFGHHDLSHHGQDAAKIAQLRTVELEKMKALADFLAKLKATREDGSTLLDRTTVFFSSNLGNAATHGVRNLPVLVAGGGFRHGQHLAFDPANGPPIGNLFVSILQRLGVPADRFGSGTTTLRGLDPAG